MDSHVGVLVGDDLALVRHVDLLPLLVRAQDLLGVDVLDHRLVVIAAELLKGHGLILMFITIPNSHKNQACNLYFL